MNQKCLSMLVDIRQEKALEAETLVEMYKSPAPSCRVLHSRPFLSFDTFDDEITHLLR